MANRYLLGFDVGSSSVKASLVNADNGKCVATAFYPEKEAPIMAVKAGWAEQDPQMWWDNAKLSLQKIMKEAGATAEEIKAIGISYQMHGLVCVDKNLKALRPAIIWCDSRAVPYGEKAFKDLEESTMGEFGGLGIEVTKDPQGVLVVSPIDDTPAARAGVLAGDIIKVRSVKSKALADHLGYIRISQFQEHTWEDVAEALQKLNASGNLKGLVLDLRNNPGGLLDAAVGVCAAFLPKGALVVSTRGRDKEAERSFNAVYADYDTGKSSRDTIAQLPSITKTVPIVVLVNTASASASEIVAGALQDHKRATIMGTKSFGKGSVQTILPLRMNKGETTGIKITTARYYTPSGRTIQAKGITPDIQVDDTPEGNYPSFNLRESDLANHIESSDTEKAREKPMKEEARESEDDTPETTPSLRYKFGDEKDFPLQQAVARLLGKRVATHADVSRAMKEKRMREKAENDGKDQKDKAGKP